MFFSLLLPRGLYHSQLPKPQTPSVTRRAVSLYTVTTISSISTTRTRRQSTKPAIMSASEPSTKKQRADGYVLYYWPGIPGRGEYIRLAFEHSGTAYTEDSDPSKLLPTITDPKNCGHPGHFAPPALKLPSGKFISQTPNILNYVAPKLGLAGDKWVKLTEKQKNGDKVDIGSEEYEQAEEERAAVNQLVLTALDLSNESHDVHHPVAVEDYYEDQKEESKRRAQSYRKYRLPKFLAHFQKVLESNPANKEGNTYLISSKTTNADLVLYHVIDGAEFAFPRRTAALRQSGKYEKVFTLKKRVESEGGIKAYIEEGRRQPFSQGLFRHYPELDGDD